MCRPAGAILHPLGRRVAPRSTPGRSMAAGRVFTSDSACPEATRGIPAIAASRQTRLAPRQETDLISQGYNGEGKRKPSRSGRVSENRAASVLKLWFRVSDLGEIGGPANAVLFVFLEPGDSRARNARLRLPRRNNPDGVRYVVLVALG